jgi:3-deoxy-manno-octulosonate cytidylyltransferase (CMP-KDO synthetase)
MAEQDRSSGGNGHGPVNPIVVIPARMASTRFPGKPLADLCGEPMIVHVWRRAVAAEIGPVIVASGDREIADAITRAGGRAVTTRPDHPSGSDRVHEAVLAVDPNGNHDAVINLQGDLPLIDPAAVRLVCTELARGAGGGPDMTTLAAEITDEVERTNPNVVKAIVSFDPGARAGLALYFTRATAPSGDGPLYHHIGIYGYRRAALDRFVALPPSPLEKRERLEQLRALEAGISIRVALVDTVPFGVDTPEDLERARDLMAGASIVP